MKSLELPQEDTHAILDLEITELKDELNVTQNNFENLVAENEALSIKATRTASNLVNKNKDIEKKLNEVLKNRKKVFYQSNLHQIEVES